MTTTAENTDPGPAGPPDPDAARLLGRILARRWISERRGGGPTRVDSPAEDEGRDRDRPAPR